MSEENWKALRQRAISYAYFRGMTSNELCEDFGQEYCLAILEGQIPSLNIQFANYMRKQGGRLQNGSRPPKHYVNLRYEELNEDTTKAPIFDVIRKIQHSELKALLKYLNAQQLLVVSLWLRGFNQAKIAQKMGLHQSRISQIMTGIILKLRKKFR
jgi:DNA-directed RNA polymerase specialized sigma24 family protein